MLSTIYFRIYIHLSVLPTSSYRNLNVILSGVVIPVTEFKISYSLVYVRFTCNVSLRVSELMFHPQNFARTISNPKEQNISITFSTKLKSVLIKIREWTVLEVDTERFFVFESCDLFLFPPNIRNIKLWDGLNCLRIYLFCGQLLLRLFSSDVRTSVICAELHKSNS